MAKGYDKHQQRLEDLNAFGKNLTRRAGSKCELCGAAGVEMSIFEVPPIPDEPDYDRCVLMCHTCREQIDNPKLIEPQHWRCLHEAIWSEVPPVQVISLRLLRRLAERENWALDLLDQAYLTEAVEKWADEG